MTWSISEDRFCADPSLESVFAVGNGYLGLRGTPEEGAPAHDAGAILNGFHETWPIVYPEDAYGLARTGQTIVNATDGSIIRLFVDDEPLEPRHRPRCAASSACSTCRPASCSARSSSRPSAGSGCSCARRGSCRSSTATSPPCPTRCPRSTRRVRIAISSELVTHGPGETSDDPRRGKGFAEKVLVPVSARADGARAVLGLATRNSGLELAVGMEHEIDGARSVEV